MVWVVAVFFQFFLQGALAGDDGKVLTYDSLEACTKSIAGHEAEIKKHNPGLEFSSGGVELQCVEVSKDQI